MPKKPRTDGFVLRSGYTVPFDPSDPQGMVQHLKQAILAETLQRIKANPHQKGWDATLRQIHEEITHVVTNMPPPIARGFLIDLLMQDIGEVLSALAEELQQTPGDDTIH